MKTTMSRSIVLICYVGAILLGISLQLALPSDESDLLVVHRAVADGASDQRMYQMLAASDADLLGTVGSYGFIVRAKTQNSEFIQSLYRNGAFLVLNASGFNGCAAPNQASDSRRYLS